MITQNVTCPFCRRIQTISIPEGAGPFPIKCFSCQKMFLIPGRQHSFQRFPAPPLKEDGKIGKQKIMMAIRNRRETDKLISRLWAAPILGLAIFFIFVYLSLWVIMLTSATFFGFGQLIFILLLIILPLLSIHIILTYLTYSLILRRNRHFERDRLLREGIIQYFRSLARDSNPTLSKTKPFVGSQLATMQILHAEAGSQEGEQNTLLWTILMLFIPFMGLYVLYFLTKDSYNHDKRQQVFMQNVQQAASKFTMTIIPPSWKCLPPSSCGGYIFLSLVFYGIFLGYWYYALISDMNIHFKAQWQFEDQLLAAIR